VLSSGFDSTTYRGHQVVRPLIITISTSMKEVILEQRILDADGKTLRNGTTMPKNELNVFLRRYVATLSTTMMLSEGTEQCHLAINNCVILAKTISHRWEASQQLTVNLVKYKGPSVTEGSLRIPASGSRVRVYACRARDGVQCSPLVPGPGHDRSQTRPQQTRSVIEGIKCPFYIAFRLYAQEAECIHVSSSHSDNCSFWTAVQCKSYRRGPGFGTMVRKVY